MAIKYRENGQSVTRANIGGGGGSTKEESQIIVDSTATVTTANRSVTKNIAVIKGDGNLSAISSNENIVTVSVSGTTLTITGVAPGEATVTVMISSTQNYDGTTADVTVTSTAVKIVTWAAGTSAEIEAMVAADAAGDLDLYDYWDDLDEKTVTLPVIPASVSGIAATVSASVTYALSKDTTKVLTTAVNGRTNSKFVIYQVTGTNVFDNSGNSVTMNATARNIGGWRDCSRRTWANGVYKTAVESVIGSIFKQFKHSTASSGATSPITLITTDNYFVMPTIGEVKGSEAQYMTSVEPIVKMKVFNTYGFGGSTSSPRNGNNTQFVGWKGYYDNRNADLTGWSIGNLYGVI